MSIILAILLLPLIATVLVALPLKKSWTAGVTVIFSLAALVLAANVAYFVWIGNPIILGWPLFGIFCCG